MNLSCSIFQRAVINISAHDNPLAAVAFNQQGTRLATASEKVKYIILLIYNPSIEKELPIIHSSLWF